MSGTFAGKVVLVTGAAMGVGAAIASEFAAEGAAVGLIDVDEAALDATVGEITAAGGTAIGFAGDIREAATSADAIATARRRSSAASTSSSTTRASCATGSSRVRRGGLGLRPRHQPQGDVPARRASRSPRCASAAAARSSTSPPCRPTGATRAPSPTARRRAASSRSPARSRSTTRARASACAPSRRAPCARRWCCDAAQRANAEDPDAALAQFAETHPIGRLIEPGRHRQRRAVPGQRQGRRDDRRNRPRRRRPRRGHRRLGHRERGIGTHGRTAEPHPRARLHRARAGPDGDADLRRPRRRRDQVRAPRRRVDAPLGHPQRQEPRRDGLVPRLQPQQAQRRRRPQGPARARAHPRGREGRRRGRRELPRRA